MKLQLGDVQIINIKLSEKTQIKDHILYVNPDDLKAELLKDSRIKDIKIDIARPGDKTRIIPVKDVIEPRVKVEGGLSGFPGLTSKMTERGEGFVKCLKGAAVVTIGDMVGFQEGIIDMWGEGAKYTPFSKTVNLVVEISVVEKLKPHIHEEVVRIAGLKASEILGKTAIDVECDKITQYNLGSMREETEKYPNLPKVVYVEMLISQGLLHDSYIYGVNTSQILPTLIHPNEEIDNAVVSGNCVAACDKITTYQHQNNSVILDLYKEHGKTLNFLGVIPVPELTTLDGKLRTCDFTAKLLNTLGADGVIVSEEGYGNPDSDLVMICARCEKKGIKTVLITDECAGWDGMSQPLADTAPEAVAVVSTGNVSHVLNLEAADKVIGNVYAVQTIAGGWEGCIAKDGSMKVELNAVIAATSEIGYHTVSVEAM
ncbi:glycine/sarcosine/betaine reductase component B subunit [Treponema pedis]|uniref:glycine/sarcosine/betaine reductase component B subunit n=1 Tax=Treponema pedis TaxID=409322 RepID=UPI003D20D33E